MRGTKESIFELSIWAKNVFDTSRAIKCGDFMRMKYQLRCGFI